jgi:hypothetical protein
MTKVSETTAPEREILVVGPYGVLGTGVLDAAAADPAWRITTAARRPAPTYRPNTAVRHIAVDLMDREGTIKTFSELDSVTDLVYAAYVEKPTMAETVEPNARMPECSGIHSMPSPRATSRFSALCSRAALNPMDSVSVPSMPPLKRPSLA